jgi:hypothetical protein
MDDFLLTLSAVLEVRAEHGIATECDGEWPGLSPSRCQVARDAESHLQRSPARLPGVGLARRLMRPVARSVTSPGWAGTGFPNPPAGSLREQDPPSEPRIGNPCRGRAGSLGRLGHDIRFLDSSLIARLRGYRPRRERRCSIAQRRDYTANARFHPDPDDRSRSSPSARLRPKPDRRGF